MLRIFREKIELFEPKEISSNFKLSQFDESFVVLKQSTVSLRTATSGFESLENPLHHFLDCLAHLSSLWNQLAELLLTSSKRPSSLRDFLLLWSSFFFPACVKFTGENLQVGAAPMAQVVCAAIRCVRLQNLDAACAENGAMLQQHPREDRMDDSATGPAPTSSSISSLVSFLRDLLVDLSGLLRVDTVGLPFLPLKSVRCCADVLRIVKRSVLLDDDRGGSSDLIVSPTPVPHSGAPSKEDIPHTVTAAFTALEQQMDLSMQQYSNLWCEKVLLVALLCEKWSAPSKYFGGRVVSHPIRYFWSDMMSSTRHGVVSSGGAAPSFPSVPHQELLLRCLHIRIVGFLRYYQDFVAHINRKISPARLVQLRVDSLFLLRLMRLLREVFSPQSYSEIQQTLRKLLAVMSIVCSSDEDAKLMEVHIDSAEARSIGSPPTTKAVDSSPLASRSNHSFLDVIWHCPPIRKEEFWFSTPLPSLMCCSEHVFLRYVSLETILAVHYPSPLTCESALNDSMIPAGSAGEPLFSELPRGKYMALIEARLLR